ncbi:hypothetical protein N7520_002199 [Penicillium odoratum]|uniref:uncharacterized protein n=1 Tax=Penicillium odoratum TaxID=1167516 RepID=UPI0025494DD8|nr:uncharacterized protein N7520_002199 [Penicillium odoratum]KAJ5771670.1 hypothetical protein N7520_002199 [Penicillium odoratum]
MAETKKPKLVIGLDFGTTFSGYSYNLAWDSVRIADNGSIAWAFVGCNVDVEVIQEWPGKGNSTSQKALTLISYVNDKIRWGYEVNDMKAAIRGVKLLLDPSQVVRWLPAAESEHLISDLRKEPVDVAGDYMKRMVSHIANIIDRRGLGDLLKTLNIQYVLTTPGVWSDKAKDLTMQAAHLAGIQSSHLSLLSEPEAAAVYTIRAIQPNSMAKGDCFIVCDAGGGTVDLITYRITQTEPLRMEEVTEGTGEVCGSVMLDERFEEYLIQTMGRKNYKELSNSTKRVVMQRWQNDIKHHYSGPQDEDEDLDMGYVIPLPGIENGIHYMESAHVQEIFDPVVTQIEALISTQNDIVNAAGRPAKAIILVGGLGASEYLYKRLKLRFHGTQIMQPPNAWSAVVRGAVYRGLEGNQVVDRKARCHYGVNYSCRFDPVLHDLKDRYWCCYEEKWMANNLMTWYIRKGQSISEDKPISFPFYRSVAMNSSMKFTDELMFCMTENAPKGLGPDVFPLCKLETDLSKISKELFIKRKNSTGIDYYDIRFNLILTAASASWIFESEFNGMNYGTVRAMYV